MEIIMDVYKDLTKYHIEVLNEDGEWVKQGKVRYRFKNEALVEAKKNSDKYCEINRVVTDVRNTVSN